ncbi:hypothetical protein BCLUESOX_595 [bacterium endosymbiont of Bathymodiolus sp. 5 South]|nr:hypothetical protein [uncultured Gammaproteobacteria bacterium]SHN93418.1 hypothetical protein BCLUESOX_595 [bacterium endosymbiont of Bathymodiolus sp. 5 South]CAC9659766.1 hypothetical protein [uncultured Gammaproteobacteria bacterium]VVH56966.1 hypothetical protein BSPCLSOX_658 [uncultured Gammaproteobacteria bacterium]VVH63954.1 hypothetical protein BSPWISOX_1282 [uncultured Gammaproteobacteria bacterium]
MISLNLVLAGLRLGLKNRQVGEKWVSDVCSYLYKGLRSTKKLLSGQILALISVQSQLLMLTRNCAAHIHTKF